MTGRPRKDGIVLMVGTDLEQAGGVATVLKTWRDAGLFDEFGVRYISTNRGSTALAKAASALRAWAVCALAMVRRKVALVHVHSSSYISFWRKSPVLALAMLTRTPYVLSLHGGAFRDFHAAAPPPLQYWIRLVLRRAQRFVVLTPTWQRWAMGVEPCTRTVVIPNSVPQHPIGVEASFGAPGVENDALLFLGRIEAAKGVGVLLAALAQARRQGAGWTLSLAGHGDIEWARARQREAGLDDTVVGCPGWVDGARKLHLLDRCALLVLPSLVENMPVVVLEAWAAGRPVVASAVGGLPDMVESGCDGWLVQPDSVDALAAALLLAWRMRSHLAPMGAAGRRKVEQRYAAPVVLAQVRALYRELLAPTDETPRERL